MKKFYSLTALLLIIAVMPSLAQTGGSFQNIWYFGAGGNFNSSWIIDQNTYGEPKLNAIFTPGYLVNFNAGVEYNRHFGVKVVLGYALMGQKYNGTQYDSTVSRTIKFSYIVLPIMIKYRTRGKVTKFYAMTGPEVEVLLSASQSYLRDGVDAPPYSPPLNGGTIDVSKKDITNRYATLSGCVRLDLGVEINPSKHFMMDIGLSNFFSITDLNRLSYRILEPNGRYWISHDFYSGINVGFNYVF